MGIQLMLIPSNPRSTQKSTTKSKIKVQYGNLWEEIKNKKFPNKWTMFVKCLGEFKDMEKYFIDKVLFKLHPSYKKNLITVTKAPFTCWRKAWGYFPIGITIKWKKFLNLPDSTATHELVF